MSLLTVDTDKCKKDGICASVCPLGIIDWSKGENPKPNSIAEEFCIACGHCVAVCPHGALSHRDMAVDSCQPIQKDLAITGAQAEQFITSRRSIRVYKDDPVPREAIEELIKVASYAPSGHNMQPAQWIVHDDRAELTRLSGMVVDWLRILVKENHPLVAMLHLDRVVERWEADYDIILRNAPVLVQVHAHKDNRTAPQGCTIAMAYLELAATAHGLGACWAGFFNMAPMFYPPIYEALNLPKDHQVFGSMMLGVPKFKYSRVPLRKKPDITWA
jgi:nitroreductase/NAD-dependent dihydropyrimidine dehydrogenase PreA subunit